MAPSLRLRLAGAAMLAALQTAVAPIDFQGRIESGTPDCLSCKRAAAAALSAAPDRPVLPDSPSSPTTPLAASTSHIAPPGLLPY